MKKSVPVFLCLFSASVFAQDFLAKMEMPDSSEKEHFDLESVFAESKDAEGNIIFKSYKVTVNLVVDPPNPDEKLKERMMDLIRKELIKEEVYCALKNDDIDFTRTDELSSIGILKGTCDW